MTRLFAGTPFDIPPRCDDCGELQSACTCTPAAKAAAEAERRRQAERLPPSAQRARVRVERRKGNRQATVVSGLVAKANDLPALLRQLQAACGAGGTVKAAEDLVELQGDHAERIRAALRELGYRVD